MAETKNEFYVRHVTQITGVKRLRLHQWIERGYIKPSIQDGQGSGTPNIFSKNDLYKIELFKKLTEGGFSRELAAAYLKIYTDREWDKQGILLNSEPDVFAHNHYLYLIFFRKDNVVIDSHVISEGLYGNHLEAKFQDHNIDDCVIINLGKIRKKINSRLSELNI